MRLKPWICLGSLLVLTLAGCCHTHCAVSDPCDPCGQELCGCGSGWGKSKLAGLRFKRHCHNYSWSEDGCCSVCGGTDCGLGGAVIDGGMPVRGPGATCGCGQSHGYSPSPMIPPTSITEPPPVPVPAPSNQNSNQNPSRTNEPNPAPASTDSTTFQAPAGQVQQVSVEEFHRLPGVVISGAGSSVPTMGTPTLAPPALSTVSSAPQPASTVQQAQWVPAK